MDGNQLDFKIVRQLQSWESLLCQNKNNGRQIRIKKLMKHKSTWECACLPENGCACFILAISDKFQVRS